MSLFPEENISTREIESWKTFADGLKSEEDKKLFLEMLQKCQKYALAISPDWVSNSEDSGDDTSKNELYNKMRLY
jgi:hypothetical protein